MAPFYIKSLIFIIFFSSCTKNNPKQKSQLNLDTKVISKTEATSDIIADNKSLIKGKINYISNLGDNRYVINIIVVDSESIDGYKNFANVNDTINIYPNYIRKEGETNFDFTYELNRKLLEAIELEDGEIVKIVAKKINSQNNWSMSDWSQ